MTSVWRLIPMLEAAGNVQMAIDRWLLEQHQSGKQPPTLRFYTWSPPAISLGYHQHKYPEHWQHLVWQGQKVELVRRPTGGRAVLHQGDLTYAVVVSGLTGDSVSVSEAVAGTPASGVAGTPASALASTRASALLPKADRIQVYQKICEFLIQGWRSLGVELHYGTTGRGYIHNPNCFGTATGADLVLPDGNKLIGSAQLRRGGAILQHGSIRLQPDQELFAEVFDTESFTPLQLPQNLDIEKIIAALIAAAIDCFDIELVVQPLSEFEWEALRESEHRRQEF